MSSQVLGRYLMVSENNLDAFLRGIGSKVPPEPLHIYELRKDGDGYSQTLEFGQNVLPGLWLMDYGTLSFQNDTEFTHKDLSGSDSKSTITVSGNKVTHVQTIGNTVEVTLERVFNGKNMTTTLSSGVSDIVATVEFELQEIWHQPSCPSSLQ